MSRRQQRTRLGLAIAACCGLLACGCRPNPARAAQQVPLLRLGILPDLDALPMVVADRQGWFGAAGVRVELVRAASAVERDQLLQAGRIDGLVTDPVALALCNRNRLEIVAVRQSMAPQPGWPQFRLLAAPTAGLSTPSELARVPVAVSAGTVAEYACLQTLAIAGLEPDEIRTVAVPGIPARMAMLRDGKVQAAVLPEPLASLAVLDGAVPVADAIDQSPYLCSILALRRAACDREPEAVLAFLAAVDRACEAINQNPEAARRWALESGLLPQPLATAFTMPRFPGAGLPSPAIYEQAARWLRDSGQMRRTPAYAEVTLSVADLAPRGRRSQPSPARQLVDGRPGGGGAGP